MIFWKLLLSHACTDFVLQPDSFVENKGKITVVLAHSSIFFLLSLLVLLPFYSFKATIVLVGLALFHGLVDYLKNLLQKRTRRNHWAYFVTDQIIHVLGIGAAVVCLDGTYLHRWMGLLSTYWAKPSVHLLFSFSVLIIFGGGFFTATLCRGFQKTSKEEKRPGLERAGRYIGWLERSMVLMAVLFGKMEFIGYLFAAKSIARYPEMKDGGYFAEYYLVGTLTSISIAFFGGLIVKYLLGW